MTPIYAWRWFNYHNSIAYSHRASERVDKIRIKGTENKHIFNWHITTEVIGNFSRLTCQWCMCQPVAQNKWQFLDNRTNMQNSWCYTTISWQRHLVQGRNSLENTARYTTRSIIQFEKPPSEGKMIIGLII